LIFYKNQIPVQHAALFLFPAPYLSERVQDLLAVSKIGLLFTLFPLRGPVMRLLKDKKRLFLTSTENHWHTTLKQSA
jgi:hypothetical protein